MKRIVPSRRYRWGKGPSRLEERFAFDLTTSGMPPFVREHRFAAPMRQWRFDFAWPEKKVAAEIEGGVWTDGRHTRGSGFTEDCEKYNAAALLGWRVFRFTGDMVKNGVAIDVIEEAICPRSRPAVESNLPALGKEGEPNG